MIFVIHIKNKTRSLHYHYLSNYTDHVNNAKATSVTNIAGVILKVPIASFYLIYHKLLYVKSINTTIIRKGFKLVPIT